MRRHRCDMVDCLGIAVIGNETQRLRKRHAAGVGLGEISIAGEFDDPRLAEGVVAERRFVLVD